MGTSDSTVLVNSVLWDNQTFGLGADLAGGTETTVRSCDIEALPFPGHGGNFSEDPLFSSAAEGDYTPGFGSPLVDRGDAGGATGLLLDLVGLPRLSDGDDDGVVLPDVGAFELPSVEIAFRRGDADAGGSLDISDSVLTLDYLFKGGEEPTCLDALDSNDDGGVDLSDPVYTLGWLFLGTPEPPEPGPRVCGPDPTDDKNLSGDLGCEEYTACSE
jgi:hypothetical protein